MTAHDKPAVALVTGASRGIGADIARRLAVDGMAVAINSYPEEGRLSAAKEVATDIQQSGGQVAVYGADITDVTAVDAMFTQCQDELGQVTALVLNAAETARTNWTDISEAEWDRIVAVNLKGAFLCCRRAFGSPSAPEQGRIVAVSSIQAKLGAPNSLHYATTKAGLVGFTRSLARELGPRGIRVNCVMPGAIRTEEELAAFPDQTAVERIVLKSQILQRRGEGSDVANVVSFLVGADSDFMTGQTVCVDGGCLLL